MWELTSQEAAEEILSHEAKWLNTTVNRKALTEAISLAVETWISFQREQRRYKKSRKGNKDERNHGSAKGR